MVLLKTSLAGVGILVLGILLITFLGQYVTMEVQDVQRKDVEPHAEFLVGDIADRPYTLPGGVSVSGSIAVTQASTNGTGDIHFMVFDDQDYQKWSSGGQANFAFSADKQGQFNFTYSTDKGGVYHFVFDNRASLFKKYIVLSVGYDEVITSRIQDTRIRTLGLVVLIAGGLVLIVGLVRKAPVSWA